jgi:tetratricopeptide (TPR) repeat protein
MIVFSSEVCVAQMAMSGARAARMFGVLVALSGVGFAASPARAQAADESAPTPEEGDARHYFQSAQKAFAEGRFVEAARAFEEAHRIKPHPAPLINAGDAWEKAGEYALAARALGRVLKMEQASEQDRADAVDRLARLKPRLGEIELIGDSKQRVRIDDEEFRGGDKVYVFPGQHRVTLVDVDSAKVRALDVEANTVRTVDLRSLEPDAPVAENARSEPSAAPAEVSKPGSDSATIRPLTWVAYGVGALGLAGAAAFGLGASSAADDFEAKYERGEPNQEDYDRFGRNKLLSNVCLGVGVVGAGVGTYLLLADLKRSRTPGEAVRLTNGGTRVRFDMAPLGTGAALVARGRF